MKDMNKRSIPFYVDQLAKECDTDLMRKYMEWMMEKRAATLTIEAYMRSVRNLNSYMRAHHDIVLDVTNTNQVTGAMVMEWYGTTRDLNDASRSLIGTALRSFFGFCEVAGYVLKDPSKILPVLSRSDVPQPGSDEEIERAYSDAEMRNMLRCEPKWATNALMVAKALIVLIGGSALRIHEALQLDVKDILNAEHSVEVVRKGSNKPTCVEVAKPALLYLKEYVKLMKFEPNAPLFCARGGERRYERREALARVSRIQKACGLHTGLHSLRHTVVTNAVRIGGYAVGRDIAGHAVTHMTDRYAHSTANERQKVLCEQGWMDVLPELTKQLNEKRMKRECVDAGAQNE